MPEFEKIIIHVLDCEQNTCVISETCIQDIHPKVEKILQSKATKLFSSTSKKSGYLKETNQIYEWLIAYKAQNISFEKLSEQIARYIFEAKHRCALYQASDLLVSIIKEEGRSYLLVMDNTYTEGITHTLIQDETGIRNEIIPYRTLLSSSFLKNDKAFLIELSDFELHCIEQKVEVEANKVNFFADIVLESVTSPSYKEAVASILKVTEEITNKYDLNQMETLPKVKSFVKDHMEEQEYIHVEEIADELFKDQPLVKDDFKEELRKQGVEKPIEVDNVKPTRSEKVHKIKTDKGIEIIIPVDYMNSREFVEFKNQPDGTISIQLKNITHITSK